MSTMATLNRWKSGDQIVVREILHGRVWSAKPVTVVLDTEELVAFYMMEGTTWKWPRTSEDGRPTPRERIRGARFLLTDATWTEHGTLYVVPPGANYAVILWWRGGDGRFMGWYINLQDPLARTPIGFDHLDQILDLIVEPDRLSWYWKDEDELGEAVELGVITAEHATALYAEGASARDLVVSGAAPFGPTWVRWEPDPAWPIPSLPVGWDELQS